ncbi:hypothetical protein G9A89_006196 [Geosiphon pyriformis]|nr:hypothetical protein G9A89_006196 [Geosiphon pyriformis]
MSSLTLSVFSLSRFPPKSAFQTLKLSPRLNTYTRNIAALTLRQKNNFRFRQILISPAYENKALHRLRREGEGFFSTASLVGEAAKGENGVRSLKYEISNLSTEEYHRLSEDTMEKLLEYFENLGDQLDSDSEDFSRYDVEYSSGVLTLRCGVTGTYVVNKQPPNKQIWLSSPVSGPKRYDYDLQNKKWFYHHRCFCQIRYKLLRLMMNMKIVNLMKLVNLLFVWLSITIHYPPITPHNEYDDEDDLSFDEGRGRFKRPALNNSGGEEDENSELAFQEINGEDRAVVSSSASPEVMDVNTPPSEKCNDTKEKTNLPNETEAVLQTISLRALVTTKEAGVIIGKAGKNVSEIRDRSGAKVTISEMVQGAYERILTVTGPLDTVAKAFALVARKVLDENLDTPSTPTSKSTTIRLLVPHSRMGPVIGKGGTKIKEIQEKSGARCLASEEMLPSSTERTISISGVPDSIHIAVFHIGEELSRHLNDRGGQITPYRPQPRIVYHQPSVTSNHQFYVSLPAPPPPYGREFMPGPLGPMNQPPPGSQAQQIFIPNDMVGCIIGKGGSKINEIRHLSGSHIKIAEPHGNTNERLVTITGTAESNQMALYLLYSRLEAERRKPSV